MGMVVLAESLNIKDTQRCSQHNNMLSGSYGMFATWVPLVQIVTAFHDGRRMIPRVVVICFGLTGLGYGGVGLIRHHIMRLVGVGEATNQHRKQTQESKTCRRTF
eukprot:scaffold82182_cov44-Attheya_sp.AAC.5